jgi:hypothetical protein
MTTIQPNYPAANLGNLYINGGRLVYGTTTTFTVMDGQFRDITNTGDIVLYTGTSGSGYPPGSGTTVSISTASNVNITNPPGNINCLDKGTVAASSIYYVYAISSSLFGANAGQDENAGQGIGTIVDAPNANTGAPTTINGPNGSVINNGVIANPSYPPTYLPAGILISLSSTGPAMPMGYDMFRRIGAIRTTAGSVIEPFIQTGFGQNRTMRYQTPVAPGAGGPGATGSSATYATIGALLAVVPQISVDVLVNCALSAGTAGNCLFLTAANGTSTPPAITLSYSKMSSLVGAGATLFQEAQLICPCALNNAATPVMEIDYCTQTYAGVGTSNDNIAFTIAGYIDAL